MKRESLHRMIGERIRTVRDEKDLTQGELAQAIGHTEDSISKIERGINGTTVLTLSKIADKLGVLVGDLLPNSYNTNPASAEVGQILTLTKELPPAVRAGFFGEFVHRAGCYLYMLKRNNTSSRT